MGHPPGKGLQQTEQKLGYSKLGDGRRARLEGLKGQQQAAVAAKTKAAQNTQDIVVNAVVRAADKTKKKEKEQ